jgi:hypothetical protein
LEKTNRLVFWLEMLWWFITALVAAGILYPIWKEFRDYTLLLPNLIFIVVFITLTRYMFLLPYTFLASRQIVKVVLIFLCIPLIFLLIEQLVGFRTLADEDGWDEILPGVDFEAQSPLIDYVRSEMLFFGIGSIISSIVFPFRMMVSIWRKHNRGKD